MKNTKIIKNKKDAYKKLKKYFNKDSEVFLSLHLDDNNRLVNEKLISIGNLYGFTFKFSHLFDTCLKCNKDNKGKVIFAHTHTNNVLSPSESDLETLYVIKQMGIRYRVNIVDYLIFNDKKIRSYKDDEM